MTDTPSAGQKSGTADDPNRTPLSRQASDVHVRPAGRSRGDWPVEAPAHPIAPDLYTLRLAHPIAPDLYTLRLAHPIVPDLYTLRLDPVRVGGTSGAGAKRSV